MHDPIETLKCQFELHRFCDFVGISHTGYAIEKHLGILRVNHDSGLTEGNKKFERAFKGKHVTTDRTMRSLYTVEGFHSSSQLRIWDALQANVDGNNVHWNTFNGNLEHRIRAYICQLDQLNEHSNVDELITYYTCIDRLNTPDAFATLIYLLRCNTWYETSIFRYETMQRFVFSFYLRAANWLMFKHVRVELYQYMVKHIVLPIFDNEVNERDGILPCWKFSEDYLQKIFSRLDSCFDTIVEMTELQTDQQQMALQYWLSKSNVFHLLRDLSLFLNDKPLPNNSEFGLAWLTENLKNDSII
ncbi:MAG: hypothetical protein ACJAS1_005577 [Oleiphilaceae bacterium]|jgi:hypothetical protein